MKILAALITLLISLTIKQVHSQTPVGRVTGALTDALKQPVPDATVSLYRLNDTVVIYTVRADGAGKFVLPGSRPGKYSITATAVSFKKFISREFTIDSNGAGIELGQLVMQKKDGASLQEVVVTARRPLMEQQVDRMVINVDAMISAPGSNALEVLEKTPGVSVELNGGISLNGKRDVLVMIDGRPTNLSANDLAAYLRSIPGGTLDKIELMDNPPARYDAAGNAIINIRLKRNKLQGLTGSLSAGINQGRYARSNDNLNLNYNRKKLSFVSSLGYNRDQGFNVNEGSRTYFDQAGTTISTIQSVYDSRYHSDAFNGRFGIDYMATEKTSYGALVNLNYRRSKDEQIYRNLQSDGKNGSDTSTIGLTDNNVRWSGASANLNFLHKYNKQGRELSGDANYIRYENRGKQQLINTITGADNNPVEENIFDYNMPSQLEIYTAQSDYSHPLPGKARIDAGVKLSHVINDSEFESIGDVPALNGTSFDPSNHFIYKETVSGMYLNSRKEWKKVSMQAGLRVENTNSDGRQLGNQLVDGTSFKRNYTSAFPSFFLSYKLDSVNKNFIDLSYSRRIRRPNYQNLNPFQVFVDQYSYSSGNPNVTPQFANQLELKYRYKKYFGAALQYGRYTDVIFQVTDVKEKAFITRPENVAKGQILALALNSTIPVAKWWNVNIGANFYHMHLEGEAYGRSLDQKALAVRGSVQSQFVFTKTLNAEISGFYNGREVNAQRTMEPRYRMNAGIQQKLLKGKATIRLNAEDILYSWRTKEKLQNLANVISENSTRSDTRRIGLSFTYSFGKDTNQKRRTLNENSASDEKNRVD